MADLSNGLTEFLPDSLHLMIAKWSNRAKSTLIVGLLPKFNFSCPSMVYIKSALCHCKSFEVTNLLLHHCLTHSSMQACTLLIDVDVITHSRYVMRDATRVYVLFPSYCDTYLHLWVGKIYFLFLFIYFFIYLFFIY